MKRLLIIGAGGFGRTVAEAALLSGEWHSITMLDDNFPSQNVSGRYSIIGKSSDLLNVAKDFDAAVCAIGNGQIRKRLTEKILQSGLVLATIVHPRAAVSLDANIGAGSTIMAGAVVGPYANIGKGCVINSNATADHDSIMEDYSQLGVGVAIAGTAILREGAWLQAGTAAGYDVEIPAWVVRK